MKIVQIALAQETDIAWAKLVALTDTGEVWSGWWVPTGNEDEHPHGSVEMQFEWTKKLPPIPQEEVKAEDKPNAQEKPEDRLREALRELERRNEAKTKRKGTKVAGRRVWGGKGRKERGIIVEKTRCRGRDAYRIDTGHGRTVLIDAKSAKEV